MIQKAPLAHIPSLRAHPNPFQIPLQNRPTAEIALRSRNHSSFGKFAFLHSASPGGLAAGHGSPATVPLPLLISSLSGNHANSVGFFPPARVGFLQPGKRRVRGRQLMPAVAHMVCHGCGAHSEGSASANGSSATRCPCGGVRQVVRIVRHPGGAASASLEELERSVQERADDETLTPDPQGAVDPGA